MMAARTVINGRTGERFIFADYGTDDAGDYLDLIESSLPSGADGPPLHRHLLGDEFFEVLDGRLGVLIEGDERVLEAGESLTVGFAVSSEAPAVGGTTHQVLRPPIR